ncbi:membrane dipeptidase [Verrucomicrobia bacterium]|nr:membrane dipeptidase [Verrucomicrobiota bacterium]
MYRVAQSVVLLVGAYLLLSGRPLFGLFLLFSAFGYWFFDRYTNRVVKESERKPREETSDFHDELFVADLHADVCLWRRDHINRNKRGHVDLPRLIEGNVSLQFVTVPTKLVLTRRLPRFFLTDLFFWSAMMSLQRIRTWFFVSARAELQLERVSSWIENSQGSLKLIRNSNDLQSLSEDQSAGRQGIGIMLGLEGAHVLRGRFNVSWLVEQGFRVVGITHFNDNRFGDSAHGWRRSGLTSVGHDLVKDLDNNGIIIDLAHCSEQLISDVIDMYDEGDLTRPPIVSHTGIKGVHNHRRNISDEQAIAVARAGGLIGVTFFRPALPHNSVKAVGEVVLYLIGILNEAGLEGVRHVAFGSDFDGAVKTVIDSSGWPKITEMLLESGISNKEIQLLMGENVRCFFAKHLP